MKLESITRTVEVVYTTEAKAKTDFLSPIEAALDTTNDQTVVDRFAEIDNFMEVGDVLRIALTVERYR